MRLSSVARLAISESTRRTPAMIDGSGFDAELAPPESCSLSKSTGTARCIAAPTANAPRPWIASRLFINSIASTAPLIYPVC